MPNLILILILSFATADLVASYTVVNGRPQLGSDESTFSFYWALWRDFSPDERRALLANGGGELLSRRDIGWKTIDCASGTSLHADGERFWYRDEIRFDRRGRVVPIAQADRPGFRYFVMASLNGLLLRGQPFEKPARLAGEKISDYRARERRLLEQWQKIASPRGTRGGIEVQAIHRLFDRGDSSGQFLDADRYRGGNDELTRYAPDRWAVFWDERAHKPHSLQEPAGFNDRIPLAEDRFRLRLEWNWCGTGLKVVARFPPGGMPAAGPTRPGRPESGDTPLELRQDLQPLPEDQPPRS